MKKLPKPIQEFIDFCKTSGYPVNTFLETELKGEEVDNDMGMGFKLRQYASIHVGDEPSVESMDKVFKYKLKYKIDVTLFFPIDKNNKELIKELWNKDKYKVIYEQK